MNKSLNLAPGEKMIYETKLHKIIFLPGALWCGTLIGVLIGVPILLTEYIRRRTSHFIVTNHRVVVRIGTMRTFSVEMIVNKIETVDVFQSFWGRIFNYGTIVLVGTGGSREPFAMLADPGKFRAAVLFAVQRRQSAAPPVRQNTPQA
jgi:uncharacterized membrane protein YdbT with pleckstrin-like domain